jgi:hypothetical protein
MDSWHIAAFVLLSVLVGALLPVLYQLRATLRSAQRFFEATGPRLDGAAAEVTAAAARVDRVGAMLEKLASSVGLAATIGAAFGPALAAGLRALRGTTEAPAPAAPPDVPSQSNHHKE